MRKTRMIRATMLAIACSLSLAVSAQTAEPKSIDIPPGDLVASLQALTRQSGAELAYREDLLSGLRVQGVRGTLTAEQALEKLLEGSGFMARRDPSGALMIVRNDAPVPRTRQDSPTRRPPAATQQAEPVIQELQQLTVTGTRIRGGSTPSPVITIGAARIQEEGFSDLGEAIRSISQNFRGGDNIGVIAATSTGNSSNQNVTGGSSLNLRGIGADASLTLINGRRKAYGGPYNSVDIAAIPVEAVARIEIVADGASAIYGSDAVGGVANVILARDFDGVSVGTRYGTSTGGGLATREYTATAGTTGSRGGLIASIKHTSVDAVDVSDRRFTAGMAGPNSLFPDSDLLSGLISGYAVIGESAELRIDALSTRRERVFYQRYPAFWYDNRVEDSTLFVSPSVDVFLPGDWTLAVSATWSKDEGVSDIRMVNATSGAESVGRHSCYCNDSRAYELGAEGPLFALPGGDARLAVGVGYRTNGYLNHNYLNGRREQGDQSSRFAYAEANLPLVGPGSDVAAAERLMLTAAVRGEDYDSFGSVVTPKLGLIYSPHADVSAKASWGRSFKAPMLSQMHGRRYVNLAPAALLGGVGYPEDATVLLTWGSNPDLGPERARSVSATLAFHPQALPGLETELSWFDIEYRDRVLAPLAVVGQILRNPALADFVDRAPTPAQQAALLEAYAHDVVNVTGRPYDPGTVIALAYNHVANTQRQRIRGVDLSGSYRADLRSGQLTLRGSASVLDSTQQNTAGQDAFDLAGTLFYPARLNARFGAVWGRGGVTASTFANHTAGVTDPVTDRKTGSFTTFDATLRYALQATGDAQTGWEFALSGQNLLDRAPPLYMPIDPSAVPYDSTNYSAIGRFLSLSISKHF